MTWHDYATEILRIYYEANCCEQLLWMPNPTEFRSFPIIFQANCSDLFGWAIADGETIEKHDMELLLDCYVDLKEIGKTTYLSELFSSRKRDRQPFDLWLRNNTEPGSELRLLFAKLPDKGAM